jgi:Cdc6-like AAA superfamily ATPase
MSEPYPHRQAPKTISALLTDKANRHGLITGATGTGKTITLQTMAEGFSYAWACPCSWPTSRAT